jgi:rhamnogalacturonyl hydrolase YesR
VTDDEELVILAPVAGDRRFDEFLFAAVDLGLYFPYTVDWQLPTAVPEPGPALRCILMDPTRAAALGDEERDRLAAFRRDGGVVAELDLRTPAGGAIGDIGTRHWLSRLAVTAGLTIDHPVCRQRLQARDEDDLVRAWRAALADELGQYERMGNYFSDPVGYTCFRAAEETAQYFDAPSARALMDAFIAAHHADYGVDNKEATGGRYLLEYAARHGDAQVAASVLRYAQTARHWRLDGVYLNQDLRVPADCDPDTPPARVRDNAWVWPETTARIADLFPALTAATGDASWRDAAVTHVLTAHHWLFDPQLSVWRHVGRPAGPDPESAPWGRGNAWFLYALRALLDDLAEDDQARPAATAALAGALDGFIQFQNADGMWHNVLDGIDTSRPCTSATGRIAHVYARAYSRGWLRDGRIPPMVEAAWQGLRGRIWQDGLVGVCVGTSYSLLRQVYLARPHHTFRPSRSELLLTWIEIQRMRTATRD